MWSRSQCRERRCKVKRMVRDPLCSARSNRKNIGVPVTYPCSRIQCYFLNGNSIFPWVEILFVIESLLPARRAILRISCTKDLPLSLGRILEGEVINILRKGILVMRINIPGFKGVINRRIVQCDSPLEG